MFAIVRMRMRLFRDDALVVWRHALQDWLPFSFRQSDVQVARSEARQMWVECVGEPFWERALAG